MEHLSVEGAMRLCFIKKKFDSGCGWPSLDESFQNAMERIPDPDGIRIEIEYVKIVMRI